MAGHLETERAPSRAVGRDGDLDGDHGGARAECARHGGETVLGNGSKHRPGVGNFDRLKIGRQNGDDFGGAHRELDVAQRQHRVAKSGYAGAVDARDGAGAGEGDVAGGKGDGDGGTGATRSGDGGEVLERRSGGATAEGGDIEPQSREARREKISYDGGEAAQREHRAERLVGRESRRTRGEGLRDGTKRNRGRPGGS